MGSDRSPPNRADGSGRDSQVPSSGSDPFGPRARRITLPHRGGTRVEVSEPIELPEAEARGKPWMCVVKLLGRDDQAPRPDDGLGDHELTQTLLVRTGRGTTPEEAQANALNQLSVVYGSPTAPPPPVIITKKASEPPPAQAGKDAPAQKATRVGWIRRLFGRT